MSELEAWLDLEKGSCGIERRGKDGGEVWSGPGFSHFCTTAIAKAAKAFGCRVECVDFLNMGAGFVGAGYEQGGR
jgi:hypothetical protein